MEHIILFDTEVRDALLPLTFTRPVAELRMGILSIREKWETVFPKSEISYITSDYLEPIFPIQINDNNLLINGALLPSEDIALSIKHLANNEAIMVDGQLIAARLSRSQFELMLNGKDMEDLSGYEYDHDQVNMIRELSELPELSHLEITHDMKRLGLLGAQQSRLDIPGDYPVYIDPSARVERAFIRAESGPVYIGPEAVIMDGASLRGPVAIGSKSIVKGHALFTKGVCIGPGCEVSGEIKRSTFLGFSNKSHEGYIGDSIIGEWCNLGALTSNSNLRNSFTEIKYYHYGDGEVVKSGQLKMGFVMGDYSRTAIHTKINSGASIGVSCHLFGEGIASGYIPSFTWGGADKSAPYVLEKAIDAARTFKSFKGHAMTPQCITLLGNIFDNTSLARQ